MKQFDVEAVPRSIDVLNEKLLCGLKNGDIITMTETTPSEVIMQSHCDGECWGLEVIHLENGEIRVLTSADDNRILAYNLKKRGMLAEG